MLQLKSSILLILLFLPLGLSAKPVTLKTEDNVKIFAKLSSPSIPTWHGGVILIHQGGSSHSEWNFLVSALVKADFVVLAYDVRGHGMSDKVESIYSLFNDPNAAPKDLKAAIQYLKSLDYVDDDRIAIVGSSIGANLANVGIANMGIKTAVAMSGKTEAVFNLAGKQSLTMRSVFYISSNEQDGARAKWAKELFEMTAKPRKLVIVPDSQAHGVSIFKDKPRLTEQVISWLKHTL